MKQTAVEWLYMQSKTRELDVFDLQQAKAMEKEQIIAARMNRMTDDELSYQTAEQYYNETYNR